jgi:hypothetical protein
VTAVDGELAGSFGGEALALSTVTVAISQLQTRTRRDSSDVRHE